MFATLWFVARSIARTISVAGYVSGGLIGVVYPAYASLSVVYPMVAKHDVGSASSFSSAGSSMSSLTASFASPGRSDPSRSAKESVERQLTQRYQQWLAYWILLALLWLTEYVLGWLLYYVPFYSWIRFLFLAFLSAGRGAEWLYHDFVVPFLRRKYPRVLGQP
eukprot:TRINITY_DN11122_c0_g1_i1.p1 TRINITY_DN11122_c0_g1~~TRINITY_DN11122_c0_g1_i1.p1  ORF type:complete len:186 (+),score=27.45 TRINITY_DN11122_c0_g1_i1:68-559(+)